MSTAIFIVQEIAVTEYFNDQKQIDSYMIFPRFLQKTDLNLTEKFVYIVLLDRARLSIRHKKQWTDEHGRIYINYKLESLAKDVGRSLTTVKNCVNALKEANLIETKQVGINEPNMIYVKIPIDIDTDYGRPENCPSEQSENKLSGGAINLSSSDQKTVCPEANKLSTSKNSTNKNIVKKSNNQNERKEILPALCINDDIHTADAFPKSFFLPLSNNELERFKEMYPKQAAEIYIAASTMARDSHTVRDLAFLFQVAKELTDK